MKKLAFAAAFLTLWAPPGSASEIQAEMLPVMVQTFQPDIAVLGEVHDNPAHHLNQAAAVAALKPRAMVFEMLTPDQAARITPALRADPEALAREIGWEEAGWPDFAIYAPIFEAAPDALIMGAALPREELFKVMEEGAERYFGVDAEAFGIDQPYPPELQAELEAEAQANHCNALPETALPGIVEAQRLRDAAFARSLMRARKTTGGPIVLITGSGHARTDLGVPAMLRKAAPGIKLLSIGQLEKIDGVPPEGAQPFDFWIVTEAAPREDPCAAFTKP
ncbi:ChaN family lipoprotein [Pseudothioclava arenosa]|nr:ChaN family lipoprotein [Pseudothioclava arenosa]